jgi:hypothetical protein
LQELEMPVLTESNPVANREVNRYQHQLDSADMAHLLAADTETIRIGRKKDDTPRTTLAADTLPNDLDIADLPSYPTTKTESTDSVLGAGSMQAEVLKIESSPAKISIANQSPNNDGQQSITRRPTNTAKSSLPQRRPANGVVEDQASRRQMVRVPTPIQKRVIGHLEYGRSLARRGSSVSARNEFVSGLKLIAQVWDYESNGTDYSQSLSKGLIALKEAKDFFDRDININEFVNPKNIVQGHQSKVLTLQEAETSSRPEALQKYLLYSQRHLVDACGNSPLAAELMYSLGKLHLLLYSEGSGTAELDQAKAMVLFRSAYSVDSHHSGAGNELAVILANNGHLQMAKKLLVNCARLNPTPVVWKNLAKVHRTLNEYDFADRAMTEFQLTQQQPPGKRIQTHPVHWVTPEQFNKIQVGPIQNIEQSVAGKMPRQDAQQMNRPSGQKSISSWPTSNTGAAKPRTARGPSLREKLKKIF